MSQSKCDALPLGYSPKIQNKKDSYSLSVFEFIIQNKRSLKSKNGGGGRIRTAEPKGTDLQSVAFSHFATPPGKNNAGDRSRTHDLLITSQLLYQLSYTGRIKKVLLLKYLFFSNCEKHLVF
jgi:hypothetical protein